MRKDVLLLVLLIDIGLCTNLDDLSEEDVLQHLLNLFDLPSESRTTGRGDRNYVYILETEEPPTDPNVHPIFLPEVFDLEQMIGPVRHVSKKYSPSPFDSKIQEAISILDHTFAAISDIRELLTVAVNVKDHINPYLFASTLRLVLSRKSKKSNEAANMVGRSMNPLSKEQLHGFTVPPVFEMFPERFIKMPAFSKDGSQLRRSEILSECRYQAPYTKKLSNSEWKVSYWREDRDINAFHHQWHELNAEKQRRPEYPDWNEPNYKHGELFLYFHQQFLARYDMERLSNRLPRTKSLSEWSRNYRIPENYIPDIVSGFHERCAYESIGKMERMIPNRKAIEEDIESKILKYTSHGPISLDNNKGVSTLGCVLESDFYSKCRDINETRYGVQGLHNMGHNYLDEIGCSRTKEKGKKKSGILTTTDAVARDPLFWRWHKFFNDLYEKHKATLKQYSKNKLILEQLEVSDFSIKSKDMDDHDTSNKLYTFNSWQKTLYKKYGCWYQPHMNSNPFKYIIRINNKIKEESKVNIRIYMAPLHNEASRKLRFDEQRMQWVLMDRFSHTLHRGSNLMSRSSCESTVTVDPPLSMEQIREQINKLPTTTMPPLTTIQIDKLPTTTMPPLTTIQIDKPSTTTMSPLTTIQKGCVDKMRICPKNKYRCKSNSMVRRICPVTCGTCNRGDKLPTTTMPPLTTIQIDKPSTTTMPPLTTIQKGCVDKMSTCPKSKYRCKSNSMVRRICPVTCGTCNRGGCVDKMSICHKKKYKCKSDSWVRRKCPVTCRTCSRGGCVDKMSSCHKKKYRCKSDSWVRRKCPVTCGTCRSGGCVDKMSICHKKKYRCKIDSWVRRKCPVTCGTCRRGGIGDDMRFADATDRDVEVNAVDGMIPNEDDMHVIVPAPQDVEDIDDQLITYEISKGSAKYGGDILKDSKDYEYSITSGKRKLIIWSCVYKSSQKFPGRYLPGRAIERYEHDCTPIIGPEKRRKVVMDAKKKGVARPDDTCVRSRRSLKSIMRRSIWSPSKMVIMPKNCYDKNKNWCHTRKVMCRAAKNDGDYVQQNCPRMCGLCIQDCWDEDDQCKQWKREGYCKTRDRVKKICPKTCFNCEGEDEDKIPCTCGLPQHLLIPQGRPEGMPFQFLVFATKHDETNKPPPSSCTDSECSDLCAIDHMECLGYSDEPMGFPFDRPLTRIGNIRMNNINDFDSALPNAKLLDVKIYHQDIVKNKSECIF